MRFLYHAAGCLVALGILCYPILARTTSHGAPAGFNGAPGSFGTCASCHGDFGLNEGSGSVTLAAPATFAPGDTLTFTVTVDNTTPPAPVNAQGFELSVHDEAGEHIGQLLVIDLVTTRYADGDENFVTHTTSGSVTETSWTMQWVAPVEAPEQVYVYVAGNAANGNGSPGGDYIYTAEAVLERASTANEPEATPLVARLHSIAPNPVADRAAVHFELAQPQPVTLTLYDGLGRAVRAQDLGMQPAGPQTAALDADGLAAGVYFLQVRTPEGTDTRPVTVAR